MLGHRFPDDDLVREYEEVFEPILTEYKDRFAVFGEKPVLPDWLYQVPEAQQETQFRKYLDKQLRTFEINRQRNAAWNDKNEEREGIRRFLKENNYHLIYADYLDRGKQWRVALAYRHDASPCPREFSVYFVTCSLEDRFSRVKARKRLVARIQNGETRYRFLFTQEDRSLTSTQSRLLVPLRFMDYVLFDGLGLPQEMVSLVRRRFAQ